jgi:hypothetical protein
MENTITLYPFICFYKGKQIDVMAETSYKAQQSAAIWFKAKKAYDITVMRADIIHVTTM